MVAIVTFSLLGCGNSKEKENENRGKNRNFSVRGKE